MAELAHILATCNAWLKPELFRDYCPNGLQVEGKPQVTSVCAAVTASLAAIESAAATGANLLLVHHGLLWKGAEQRLIGSHRARVAALLQANINLLAYHLPLDCHPVYGNNAQLAKLLGIVQRPQARPTDVLALGDLPRPMDCNAMLAQLHDKLGEQARHFGAQRVLGSLAWCTGAGGDFFSRAQDAGADGFITGELSERHYHQAEESGIALFAAGHHATERYGVQALAEALAAKHGIGWWFFDQPNPL